MTRRLLAFPGEDPDRVGLDAATGQQLGLRPDDGVWVAPTAEPTARRRVSGWSPVEAAGPDGCLLPPALLASLELPVPGLVTVASARRPGPRFHLFSWTRKPPAPPAAGEDLVLCLDTSGSMAGAPLRLAGRAVRRLAERWAEEARSQGRDHRLGLVTFGGDGARLSHPLSGSRSFAGIAATVETAAAGGLTPLGLALDRTGDAFAELRDDRERRGRRVVLVSDGLACGEPPDAVDRAVERLIALQVPVTTLGVGTAYDRGLLHSIAARTGDRFVAAVRLRDLTPVLEEIL